MKKTVFIIAAVVIAIIVGIIAFLVVSDLKQEELLKQEVINLTNKDLTTADFTIEVKTKGDYAYIEEAIKKYYLQLSDALKDFIKISSNENLNYVLDYDFLDYNRPDYKKSYDLLEETKTKSNLAIEKIINMCDEQTILNLIDKEKVDSYYYDLYKDLMYTEKDLEELKNVKSSIETTSDKLNKFLDKSLEMLDYFKKYNDAWYVEDEQLYFETQKLADEFNIIWDEFNELAKDLEENAGKF